MELYELREQIIRLKKDESVPMVIVGNNSDLEDQRAVSRAKASAVSSSWGSPYYETSQRLRGMFVSCLKLEYQCAPEFYAHNTPESVDDVFIDLCRQIILKNGL